MAAGPGVSHGVVGSNFQAGHGCGLFCLHESTAETEATVLAFFYENLTHCLKFNYHILVTVDIPEASFLKDFGVDQQPVT